MASSTIDLLLKTKADTSGVSQIKSAIQSTNQELVLMGKNASHGAKSVDSLGKSSKEASQTLYTITSMITALGALFGGKIGQAISKVGAAFTLIIKVFQWGKPILLLVGKGISAIGGACTMAVSGLMLLVAAAVKLNLVSREAHEELLKLQATYKEGFKAENTEEGHEAYARRLKEEEEAIRQKAEEQKRIEEEAAERRKATAEEVRKIEEISTDAEYQRRIDNIDKSIAYEKDERKKLILERQRVELEAERRLAQAETDVTNAQDSVAWNRADAEAASAERKLALEQERTALMLQKFDDDRIKAEKERLDAEREIHDKQLQVAKEEQERLHQKELVIEKERRANEIRKTTTEKILSLEKEITNAKEQADNWNRNADAARGQSFGDWSRDQRDNERADRDAKNQRAKNIDRAKNEYDRLRSMNPKAMSKWHKNRIAQLSEYLGYQSGNNPHLKTLEEKEQERDNLQKSMDEHLKNLDEAISGNVALQG